MGSYVIIKNKHKHIIVLINNTVQDMYMSNLTNTGPDSEMVAEYLHQKSSSYSESCYTHV